MNRYPLKVQHKHHQSEPTGYDEQLEHKFMKMQQYSPKMNQLVMMNNNSAAPIVTRNSWTEIHDSSAIQTKNEPTGQVLLLKKHDRTHTRDEPFSYSQCDFEFSTSSTIIDEAWRSPH